MATYFSNRRRHQLIALITLVVAAISMPASAINTESSGYQVVNGAAAVTINPSHSSSCREVSNASGKDQFVSTATAAEWASFLANVPSGMTAAACGGGPPAPTLVQTTGAAFAAALTHNISFSANTTIGNVVIVAAAGRASTHQITSITGCGATFTEVADKGITNGHAEIFVGVCTTAATQITVNSSTSLLRSVQIFEFANLTGALDVADAGTNQNSFTNSTVGVTSTRANTVIIAAGSLDKAGTAGAGPNNSFINAGVYNGGGGPTVITGFFTYRIIPTAGGPHSTTWTLSGTGSPNSCFISAAIY